MPNDVEHHIRQTQPGSVPQVAPVIIVRKAAEKCNCGNPELECERDYVRCLGAGGRGVELVFIELGEPEDGDG